MEIKKIHSDSRGSLYQYDMGSSEYLIVTFNEGVMRGGHYHNTEQRHTVISGNLKVLLHNLETGEDWEKILGEGDTLLIPPKVAHLFIAVDAAVLIESREGTYEAAEYGPYRELVRNTS